MCSIDNTPVTDSKLHRLEVQDAPSAGAPDLPGRWALRQYREDARGCFIRTRFYPSRTAAIAAAKHMQKAQSPGCDLGVYCERCRARHVFVGGFMFCACPVRRPATRTVLVYVSIRLPADNPATVETITAEVEAALAAAQEGNNAPELAYAYTSIPLAEEV